MKESQDHLLVIGIAGAALSGLALAAQQRGYRVTGLDERAYPPVSDWLDRHGFTWTRHKSLRLLDGVNRIIMNNELPLEDELIAEAGRRGIAVQSFAEFLGELTRGDHTIAVTGTHGKTTTTALIAWLLHQAGRRPNFLIGAQPFNFDVSVRLDGRGVTVLEGDEYSAFNRTGKSKVQYYHPDVLLITSLEHDHPDIFPTFKDMTDRFAEFVTALPKSGRLISWAESDSVAQVAKLAPCPATTYGLERGDYTAANIELNPDGIAFDMLHHRKLVGRLEAPLYGRHNVMNVLAAAAVALGEQLSFEQIRAAAATFRGTYRRFNLVSRPEADIAVLDDYGHHPTEVATTIQAARLHFPGRRIVAVFQPHTYSRTRTLLGQYQHSFGDADLVYVTEVESARESADEQTVSGRDIAEGVGDKAVFEPDRAALLDRLATDLKPGDVVVFQSVGGYGKFAPELAERLAAQVA